MAGASSIWQALTRKRVFEPHQLEEGNLRRCLSIWDLTALGVGSTLGVGVYVIVGSVALHHAGPSIVLSFLIAAVASLFAGLCYAEFGARVPKAGSAYIYTYVTVGEFVAFVIGWNMILEALFGTASVAKGLSLYVDSMVNKTMSEWMTATMPISATVLSPYFDLVSFAIVLILGVLLAIGVRESSMVNNVFAGINMLIILFIIFAGAFKANSGNWSIPAEEVPAGGGAGGFFPFGVWGVLRGAAICFYGFVGFDTISSTGEEVRSPRRALPLAIVATLGVVLLAYASVSVVITMMVPYYLQDDVAAVATVFSHVGMEWARWIVSIGAVFGISASLFGAMFPLPRLLYSMATDGLLWHLLARLNSRKTPVIGTILPAAIIAILAAIMELNDLVLMMCIGTLLSYTIVAVCIILLRYRSDYSVAGPGWVQQVVGLGVKAATTTSALIVHVCLLLFTLACVCAALAGALAAAGAAHAALSAAALLPLAVIALQPQRDDRLAFKTPLVPIVPCLSIYVNIQLMVLINVETWIRVAVWMAIGIPVYILCTCIYKRKDGGNLQENLKTSTHANKNGKPPVQIVVETPTPPGTTRRSNTGGDHDVDDGRPEQINVILEDKSLRKQPIVTEEIIIQHAYIEDNEEKEAKIIDLLDQVLQAEEDSYGEIISLKEQNDDDVISTMHQTEVHRKSLSELSDAGSDASMGNQVLSKYDVIAQVHREDLPKVNEEDEVAESNDLRENEGNEHEEVTAFNDSDTNSRTDESGYSDTIDRMNESAEDMRQETINIPKPPPLDENYFKSPTFKKAYTISARPTRPKSIDDEEENKPRESINSNNSNDDGTMVFGSDKQMNFMSKLENIFQNKMTNDNENDEQRKRSNSTGNVVENTEFELNRSRPSIFLDLKKELLSRTEQAQSMKQTEQETKTPEPELEPEEEAEETSLSREDLKSKLETIFAAGGPHLLKPRFMKSNPPTPEESYQTDTSSNESIAKLPKVEKNDTLKRQKDRYGEVLNSFRLSLNKGDEV